MANQGERESQSCGRQHWKEVRCAVVLLAVVNADLHHGSIVSARRVIGSQWRAILAAVATRTEHVRREKPRETSVRRRSDLRARLAAVQLRDVDTSRGFRWCGRRVRRAAVLRERVRESVGFQSTHRLFDQIAFVDEPLQ